MKDITKLAKEMYEANISRIFGIPGSGLSLQLLDELEKKNINFIRTHIEASAPLMAAAFQFVSGKKSAAISIRGPGLTNMLPGIAASYFERFPTLSISEAIPASAPSSQAHKRLNHSLILKHLVKSHFYLSDADSVSEMFNIANSELPAPIHLDLCEGEKRNNSRNLTTEFKDDNAFYDLLKKSQRPIIIAGTFAIRRQLMQELASLSIPVMTTAAAKGAIDEALPHSAGVYTGVGLNLVPEKYFLKKADLIVGIGLLHSEVLSVKKFDCPSLNVIDPSHIEHCIGFLFDLHVSISKISELFYELKKRNWGIDEISLFKKNLSKELLSRPFSPAHVYDVIETIFKGNVRICLDTGNFCVLGEHCCNIRKPELYLSSGQSRYMGIGIPLAIGASIGDEKVPTILCVGDGGVGMFSSELKIASEFKTPLCIIFMKDSYFASIRVSAVAKKITEKPLKITNSSWLKSMEGFGIPSTEVKNPEDLALVLKKWVTSRGPLFVEVNFDPDSYMNSTKEIR